MLETLRAKGVLSEAEYQKLKSGSGTGSTTVGGVLFTDPSVAISSSTTRSTASGRPTSPRTSTSWRTTARRSSSSRRRTCRRRKNVDLALAYKHEKVKGGSLSTSNGTITGGTIADGKYDEIGVWAQVRF